MLARRALLELAAAMEEIPSAAPASEPSMASRADAERSKQDAAALREITAASDAIPFSEARDNTAYQTDISTEQGAEPMAAPAGPWWPAVVQGSTYPNTRGRVGKLAFY